jgi:hypothetical protein
MSSIEQVIQQQTRLSASDLALAANRRQEIGGLLETALLELDLITETELAPVLAAHYGLPAATADDLRDIPESIQALLSRELTATYSAVPFAAGPGRVDMAITEPLDLKRADELAFLLGRRVRFFVINEVRVARALQHYYGHRQPARLLNLADRLDRGPAPEADPVDEPTAVRDPIPPAAPSAPRPSRLGGAEVGRAAKTVGFGRRVIPTQPRDEARSIELTAEERQAIFGPPQNRAPSPAATSVRPPASELARLTEELQAADSPTAVAGAFLDYLQRFFPKAMLLRPEGELFRGWLAKSADVDDERLRELLIGPGLAAEWRVLLATEDTASTRLSPSAVASGLDTLLGLRAGDLISLMAIRMQSRVVCLAVCAAPREPERSEVELLRNAGLRAGIALQGWILRHRSHPDEPS